MTKRITKKQCENMAGELWGYYDQHGRHDLAWRTNPSPYRVVVSEIMLQQTQVARVEQYFKDWMKKYPSWRALSRASLRSVLFSWQGLGYNRRGKYLHDIAQIVTEQCRGTLPSSREELEALPGIGHYTAGSIRAFAFDELDVFLETNIRTVLFHHLYQSKGGPTSKRSEATGAIRTSSALMRQIDDKELLMVLKKYLKHDQRARENPRDFYYAMMDYGSYLKKSVGNLNKQSRAYTKQSRFEGSRRQLRSQILRYVLNNGPVSEQKILEQSNRDHDLVQVLLGELVREGGIIKKNTQYFV